MIIKLYTPYIEQVVDNIDSYIRYLHQCNLTSYQNKQDVAKSDGEVTALLGLKYQLKNLLLVEQTSRKQANQRIEYLRERRRLLFDYLAIKQDNELDSAIKSIQNELNQLTQSLQVYQPVDIEISTELYELLKSKNLLN